ncbi:hypothetical protein LCM00_02960 [Bacillus infantis]|uniref:hypothetical protein n=1 Tax=Bacillus infantis TaxID=324767 RepID=UPI001CD24804|nr:hypothetical protein [Bacillus infantis]MCA1038459.1 hypothetical protein [Bacillus infantis]
MTLFIDQPFKEKIAFQALLSAFIYAAFTVLAFLFAQKDPLLRGSVIICSFLFFILDFLFDTEKRLWILSGWNRKK